MTAPEWLTRALKDHEKCATGSNLNRELNCIEWRCGLLTPLPIHGLANALRDHQADAVWAEFTLRSLKAIPTCPTPDCPGDARYAAPGRGHRTGCAYPLTEDLRGVYT